ncbi:MAG: hypothetical protein HXX81_06175 [Campylobacterales bacterium]|nr:hypothetical protein [Campylobacterales bacterium]
MKNMFIIFSVIIIIFFTGCSSKMNLEKKSVLVMLKTDKLKYYDTGFLALDDIFLHLELFNVSTPIVTIKIENNEICFDKNCLEKRAFVDEYLSKYYEQDILFNIFSGKEIFNAKNLIHESGGFTQYIKDENLDIIYIVNSKEINFYDNFNGIKIKLKKLK